MLSLPAQRTKITYFFCRFNDQSSLQATTILRSLLRQCLDAASLPTDIETSLTATLDKAGAQADDFGPLLKAANAVIPLHFIIIDGVDECPEHEQAALFTVLRNFGKGASTPVKILFASREKVASQIRGSCSSFYDVVADPQEIERDIAIYIESALCERLNDGSLIAGSQDLVRDIQDALVSGAQGMFLWVTLQIHEICNQTCDEDVRTVIKDLPPDLTETYLRILSRIEVHGRAALVLRIFNWVAVARRPLTLPELREALSVEPYAAYSNPERIVNDIDRIIQWCEGLIIVDEQDLAVEFLHPTVQRLLEEHDGTSAVTRFTLSREIGDRDAGIVCVTYLNFNDFKTQLIRSSRAPRPTTNDVLQATSSSVLSPKLAKAFQMMRQKYSTRKPTTDVVQKLACLALAHSLAILPGANTNHPFLSYASEHWLSHTADVREGDRIWSKWKQLLDQENGHIRHPWNKEGLSDWTRSAADWAARHDHVAVVCYLHTVQVSLPRVPLTRFKMQEILDTAATCNSLRVIRHVCRQGLTAELHLGPPLKLASAHGFLEIVDELLGTDVDVNESAVDCGGHTALQLAAGAGHIEVVERLLSANANVNSPPPGGSHGRTALQAAIEGRHLNVVERLLSLNADVNAPAAEDCGTALQIAAGRGQLEMVEILLCAKAEVNALPMAGPHGRTALQAAAEKGHLPIVERLLAHNADVNGPSSVGFGGCTALQGAAKYGNLEVVERLLFAKADVNAPPAAGSGGRTALQAAAERGHLGVVERLLSANAAVNAPAVELDGRTALQAAAKGGHLEVIECLLAAEADVNAPAVKHNGRTALQAAAERGHLHVIEKLLSVNADVNAPIAEWNGCTALQAAVKGGHLQVVKRLISANALVDAPAAGPNGYTALQAAEEGRSPEILALLRRNSLQQLLKQPGMM